ncbi:hypothetical protein E2C01_019192 [Portunus trituberculatus]|uniref:Uncharacterized protein n=1 Tax=Portunus trituberculatus TaxID=210409 RepID=A0A5B7DWK9_PORTR|nr:hypothetical protein [Portunus trituberculatus]
MLRLVVFDLTPCRPTVVVCGSSGFDCNSSAVAVIVVVAIAFDNGGSGSVGDKIQAVVFGCDCSCGVVCDSGGVAIVANRGGRKKSQHHGPSPGKALRVRLFSISKQKHPNTVLISIRFL